MSDVVDFLDRRYFRFRQTILFRRFDAMMTMKKIDIAAIEAARRS